MRQQQIIVLVVRVHTEKCSPLQVHTRLKEKFGVEGRLQEMQDFNNDQMFFLGYAMVSNLLNSQGKSKKRGSQIGMERNVNVHNAYSHCNLPHQQH